MDRLPIFFNELSRLLETPVDSETLLASVRRTLTALRAVIGIRRDLLLASDVPIANISLGNERQPLGALLRGDRYKDEWRFLNSLDQRSPWSAHPATKAPKLLEEVTYLGAAAIGMTWARVNDSAVFSFGHPQNWDAEVIHAEHSTVDIAGSLQSLPVEVRNLSAPEHVEAYREIIVSYGNELSPSSLIYQTAGYVIRMYWFDHNPPHFHVLFQAGAGAKCAIETFDVLAGRLPLGIRSQLAEWTRNHRDDLIRNWDRCQTGRHPFVVRD